MIDPDASTGVKFVVLDFPAPNCSLFRFEKCCLDMIAIISSKLLFLLVIFMETGQKMEMQGCPPGAFKNPAPALHAQLSRCFCLVLGAGGLKKALHD